LGKHRGKYAALTQCGPVKVFRDPTLDDTLNMNEDSIMEGIFGINVHKAGSNSTLVNKWSAGCVVLSNEERYSFFLDLCKKQVEKHPTWTKYSLTLLEEW